MILYHYTDPSAALSIGLGGGLMPSLGVGDECADQTFGIPVVWLTRQESNLATADYVAGTREAAQAAGLKIEVGQRIFGGPVRCEIEIERSKYLMSYADFLQKCSRAAFDPLTDKVVDTPSDVLRKWRASGFRQSLHAWWVSTRQIPASKVWVPLTRAQAIEGCEWHIERCRNAADKRENWTGMRDTLAAEPDETAFALHAGECLVVDKAGSWVA